MGNVHERRLRAIMLKAGAREKAVLVLNSLIEPWMGRSPILTQNEANDLQQSLTTEDEWREFVTISRTGSNLFYCVVEAESLYRKLIAQVAFLGQFFRTAREYRSFENLLSELCIKNDGTLSERLQKRIVSTGRGFPYFFNIALREESDGSASISLQLSNEDQALVSEVVESIQQVASQLKAVTQVVRDVMTLRSISTKALSDSVDRFEKGVREAIRATKLLVLDSDSEGWNEFREVLSKHADPLLMLMESLADYDDIAFDEAAYDATMSSVTRGITSA